MDRALVYLLLARGRNALREMVRKPSRLLATALLLGLFVSMILLRGGVGDLGVAERAGVISSLLALYLLLSLFGGLGEPGPVFAPADVDFVLTAPFRRRDLLAYHLVRHYFQTLFLGLFYAVLLGATDLPSPLLAYVGIVLCLVVCTHLQTAMMLLSASLGDRVFGRLRLVTRLVLTLLLGVALLLVVGAAAGAADVPAFLREVLASRVASVLLYPAIAAGQLGLATDGATLGPPLAGLLLSALLSFGLVLLFPLNFVETAATREERTRRVTGGKARRARSAVPWRRLFAGGGALAWVNLLTLKRRLRLVVSALVMLTVMLVFVGVEQSAGGGSRLLLLLAFYGVIVQMPFGFKGHLEHLEMLKTLPVTPFRLACGQVAVPAGVLWVLQTGIVAVFAGVGRVGPEYVALAVLVYPLLDIGIVALGDLFQLGRDRRHASFLVATGQMLAMVASTLPAAFGGILVFALTERIGWGAATAVAIHACVVLLLLHLLGRRFARWEPGSS